ncbi:MAG: HEAT repeat domain-containing protein, partial [Bryobacterales bacterium]|nr:HEAT repeat domain-containing protein [Bryobacterales bacterium]
MVSILAKGNERKGEGLLLSTLIQNDQLASRLGDPDFCTREEAISIARRASRIDPSFERQISQILTGPTRLADEEVARLLAVMESISTPANLLPLLNSISHHSSPRIRSKAALLMGRGKRNSAWVMEQLTEPDGRVRANAVESIWGLDGADVLEVFSTAAYDPAPRVAINAGIGLYRARQTRSIELFVNWASHEDFAFRRSACWGMGQTQDPRFLPVLVKCIRDSDPTVRSHALRSSSTIRAHINALKQEPVAVHIGKASILENGMRTLSVSLRSAGGSAIPILCPLAFSLDEDGLPVTRYELTRALPDAAGAIGLVLPRALDLAIPFRDAGCAALRCALDQKLPAEAWSTVCYSHADAFGEEIAPLLQTSPGQLQKGIELANRSFFSGAIPAIET